MTITMKTPNKVHLGGPGTEVNDLAASATITPGMLVARDEVAGVIRLKPHATAGGGGPRQVAVEQSMLNLGVDDDYSANDLVETVVGSQGSTFWMFIASGQDIDAGDLLESAGDGSLRILASGVPLFAALESKTAAFTGLTRIRVEVA